MIRNNGNVRSKASTSEPRPYETDIWYDLRANPYGGVAKYYNEETQQWQQCDVTYDIEQRYVNKTKETIDEIKAYFEKWVSELQAELEDLREEMKIALKNKQDKK